MNWKKSLGFGALIWAIMFVVISFLVAYKLVESGGGSTVMSVVLIIVSLVLAYLFAKNVSPKNMTEAMSYGLTFAVVGIVLDFIISQRFAPGMFNSVYYWISYVLMVFVPMLAVKKTV